MNLVIFMDRMLKENGLDLCLSPYNVMATSLESGFVEMVVPSITMSGLLSQYKGGVQEYLRILEFSPQGPQALSESRLENYVRSNAGYAAITYILGVGDRHFDNILVTEEGKLFHIDFGFLFGNDPKPLPPLIRICKEMVDGMGGVNSENFKRFVELSAKAYIVLRNYSSVISNYLSLMATASIAQLSLNPKASIQKVVKRFRLDLDEESASQHMKSVISKSLKAVAPNINEHFHKIAQTLK